MLEQEERVNQMKWPLMPTWKTIIARRQPNRSRPAFADLAISQTIGNLGGGDSCLALPARCNTLINNRCRQCDCACP